MAREPDVPQRLEQARPPAEQSSQKVQEETHPQNQHQVLQAQQVLYIFRSLFLLSFSMRSLRSRASGAKHVVLPRRLLAKASLVRRTHNLPTATPLKPTLPLSKVLLCPFGRSLIHQYRTEDRQFCLASERSYSHEPYPGTDYSGPFSPKPSHAFHSRTSNCTPIFSCSNTNFLCVVIY